MKDKSRPWKSFALMFALFAKPLLFAMPLFAVPLLVKLLFANPSEPIMFEARVGLAVDKDSSRPFADSKANPYPDNG